MHEKLKFIFIKLTAITMSILMVFSVVFPVYAAAVGLKVSVDDVSDKISKYMLENAEDYGGVWSVIGLARSNISVNSEYYESYYENLKKSLKENDGILSKRKYTEYSGAVIALTAIGKDPSNVAGYNLLARLSEFDNVVYQGINGAIWALIAIDAGEYNMPCAEGTVNTTTREKLIDYILSREIAGGGWSMNENTPDPDVTAMALQSLAKYQNISNVKSAVDKGLAVLSKLQKNDGGYESWGTANSESDAQVIVALCSLGVDPVSDERFIKNGSSVLANLINRFYVSSKGGFMHIDGTDVDLMATNQGFYALVAYDRFIKGNTRLYDMSDVEKRMSETLFMPDAKITRAQFAAIVSKALCLDEIKADIFSDVKGEHWFLGYVAAAVFRMLERN